MSPADIAEMWEYVNTLDGIWVEKMTEKHKETNPDSGKENPPNVAKTKPR